MRTAFWVTTSLLLAVALTFLTLPVLAILLRVSPGQVVGSGVARDALMVTLRTNLIANLVFVAVGTPAAYLLATGRLPGRALLLTLTELPLVLPPAVAGIGLLVAFGRMGMLGEPLTAIGVTVPFTELAVILAVLFVAGPFYLRGAVAAFTSVDPVLLDAARTLGAGPARVFARVAVPLAAGGLATGWVLAFARGVGEFGATVIVAGSVRGHTQTLPLAVYAQFESDFGAALAAGALLIVFAAALLVIARCIPVWTTAFTSTSASRAAISTSR